MALTFDTMVDRLVSQFDVSTSTAAAWLNERQARMVAEAQWRTAVKSIGTTVANQANYTLPTDVTDLTSLRIDGNGTTDVGLYTAVGLEELWQVDSGQARMSYRDGGAGVFAEDPTDTGAIEIRIHPAPVTTGLDILGLQVLAPATLTYGAGSSPVIPDDLRPFLLDGAMADGYMLEDERHDLAQFHEARFERGTELLRRRRNSRTGSGPGRLRVSRRP